MKVLSVVSQRKIKNPNGRSVRLDIYAVDSEGRHYEGDRIDQLMHDFRCVEADDIHNKILADKVRYFKETD